MALADWQRMTGYTEVGGHPDLSFRVADHPGTSRVISWIEMPSATTSAGSAFAGVSPAVPSARVPIGRFAYTLVLRLSETASALD